MTDALMRGSRITTLPDAGKMEGGIDYDREENVAGKSQLDAEAQGHTGGGDLLSRTVGHDAVSRNQ